MMTSFKKKIIIFLCIIIFLILFFRPVDAGCGAPGDLCNSGLYPDGYYTTVQVTEPAGIYFLESIFDTDIEIEYTSELIYTQYK